MMVRTLIALTGTLALLMGSASGIAAPATLQSGQQTMAHLPSGGTQVHLISAGPGQEVRVTVRSEEFTPRVTLRSGGAASSAHGSNTQVRLSTPQGGTYQCEVESATPGQSGTYMILAEVQGALAGGPSTVTPIAPGQTIGGVLGRGDDTMVSGEYRDRYVLQGVVGQQVTITLTSSDFDSYLILRPPSGARGTDDDDSAGGRDARITTTLSETGPHMICVTTVERDESGAYRLTVH